MRYDLDWLEDAQLASGSRGKMTQFGYDAIEDNKRRRSPKKTVQAEDRHLKQSQRKTLIATARDVRRNFAVARFIIQKHIDFVVEHNFLPRSGNTETDRKLKQFFVKASKKQSFDVSGRFSLRRYMRLMESARITDGDFLTVKFRDGRVQGIEGDRIRDPELEQMGEDMGQWVNGVKINRFGRHQHYSIHRRSQTSFQHERTIRASKTLMHGFYDRHDQTRGVSPLSPVVNSLKDLYESWDYALARTKVEQLFALAITKSDDWGIGADDEEDNDVENVRELDFEKGPQILDLDSGETAAFLNTAAPAGTSQEFWKSMIMMTLKCLNIPYFFYDEKNTNFFGAKSGLTLYLRSVRGWREDVVDWLNDWFCWRLKVGIQNGEIDLPEDFDCDTYENWDFQPLGIEYWNPVQEMAADEKAIELGLRTREEIRLERYGDSWEMDVFPRLVMEKPLVDQLDLHKTPPMSIEDTNDEDTNRDSSNADDDVSSDNGRKPESTED